MALAHPCAKKNDQHNEPLVNEEEGPSLTAATRVMIFCRSGVLAATRVMIFCRSGVLAATRVMIFCRSGVLAATRFWLLVDFKPTGD